MKSESFRKQALCLVLFFAAVAAVFALTRLRSDPAKKQAEFVVQQLLSCSSAVEQAVDAAAPAGSEPGLAAVDTDGLYAFLQAQLGDAMTADCLNKVMANRLPTRITALAGQSGEKLVAADLYSMVGGLPDFAENKLSITYPRAWYDATAKRLYREGGEPEKAELIGNKIEVPKGRARNRW